MCNSLSGADRRYDARRRGSRCSRRHGVAATLDWRKGDVEAVARIGDGPHFPSGMIVGCDCDSISIQEMPSETLGLHVGEIQSQAHMRAAAEWHESEFVSGARGVRIETQRIVTLRVGPNLRHVMGVERVDVDARACRNAVTHEFENRGLPGAATKAPAAQA